MWEVEVLYRVRGRKTEGVGQSEIRDKEKSPGQYGVSKQCRHLPKNYLVTKPERTSNYHHCCGNLKSHIFHFQPQKFTCKLTAVSVVTLFEAKFCVPRNSSGC
jgi:hypothetical protein